MGCILACLRFKVSKKRNKAQLKSSPVPSKAKEPLLSEDQFVSVFVSEGSTCVQVADLKFEDNRDKDIFDRELEDQVKILKYCGAILETPAELRVASSNSSCIPATPIKKLVWEELQEDSELAQNSAASASKTSSCVPGTHKLVLDEEQECSNFEQPSSAGVADDSPSQGGTRIQAIGGKNSPYPTPLQLRDEMETPCTVYPSTRENLRWKNGRVRTQYVYPVLNPVENLARLNVQRTPVTLSSNDQNDEGSPERHEFDKENYSLVKKLRSLTPFSSSEWKEGH